MAFVIETTPSAALLDDLWSTIEETNTLDEARDYLKSPRVDLWQDALVRVRNGNKLEETGIWHDGQFVDLSHDSEIGQAYPWYANADSRKYFVTYGFPDAWRNCRYPKWMLMPLEKVKFTREEHFLLALSIVKDCQEDESNKNDLDILENHPDRAAEIMRPPTSKLTHAINYLSTFLTEKVYCPFYAKEAMRVALNCVTNEDGANILRKHMTFDRWVKVFFAP